jgi:hypothetical protein
MQRCERVGHGFTRPPTGLLEEWVRRPVRRGEEDDPLDVSRNACHGGGNSGARGNPHQEHRIDIVQGPVESGRNRKVAANDLDLSGQIGGIRVANQGADPDIRGQQLRDDLAPNSSRGSDNEDSFHTRPA